MQAELLKTLSQITQEEQYLLIEENSPNRSLYGQPGRFIIERRRLSHLVAGEATAPFCLRPHPRFRAFPAHSHDFIEIMYVCCGSITHIVEEEKVKLDTDDLILFGRQTEHSVLAAGAEDIGINLIISPELFESLLRDIGQNTNFSTEKFESLLNRKGLPYLRLSAKDSLAVRNLMETLIGTVLCEKNTDGYLLRQSLHLLLCYLGTLPDAERPHHPDPYTDRMQNKILNYIKTSYSTATLTEAAAMMGLSPSYLSRWIEERFGASFKTLVMKERFDTACSLLTSTDMAVGEILNRVGYENSSYFHKEFKRRYGLSPMRYRKQGSLSERSASAASAKKALSS